MELSESRSASSFRAPRTWAGFARVLLAVVLVLVAHIMAPEQARSSDESVSTSKGYNVGDPIRANSGEYYVHYRLRDLGGPLPLAFTLTYKDPLNKTSTALLRNDPPNLMRVGLQATLSHFGEAKNLVVFQKSAGAWTVMGNTNVVYVLKETGADDYTGWFYVMDPIGGLVYVFEKRPVVDTTNTEGRLRLVMDRNGNRLTYLYGDDSTLPARIEDGLGRSLDFAYSVNNTAITDQTGRVITIHYHSDYPESEAFITSAMGHATKLVLDLNDNVLRTEMPLGNIPYTQTYIADEVGMEEVYRTATQTDAYGNKTTLGYGDGVTVTAPDGGMTTFEHWGENGSPKSVTDPTGKQATFQNTLRDQIGGIDDRLGGNTSISYQLQTGKIEGVTNALGNTISRSRTAQDQTFSNPLGTDEIVTFTFQNLTRIDYPDGSRELFTRDVRGNLVEFRNRAGAKYLLTYNERGQVLTVTNPAGGVTTRTYNADGTLASLRGSDTGLTMFGYDGYKRVNNITRSDGGSALIAYDLDDHVISTTDEKGHTYTYTYDANGNLDKITDPAGKETLQAQDLMDRLIQTTDRLGNVTTLSYDGMGRLASRTFPSGRKIEYGYDPRGWMTEISLGDRKWLIGYNDEGVATSRTTPAGRVTTFEKDALGRTTSITDPLAQVTTFTYDTMNRLTGATDPLGRKTSFSHDKRGDLSAVSLPVLGAATYLRNSLGLLNQVVDTMGFRWNFGYNRMGRMNRLTDPSDRNTTCAYDQEGRPRKVTYADGSSLVTRYDKAGNVSQRKYSAGPTLSYSHDAMNRLVAANDVSLRRDAEGRVTATKMHGIVFSATHDEDGRVRQIGYADDAFWVAYTYDPVSGLLKSVRDSLTGTRIAFAYDADGNPVRITRFNGVIALLTYDAAGRLERIRDGSILDLGYAYNAANRITNVSMKAPLDPAAAYTASNQALAYDGACQITSTGYEYDVLGRLTASPGHTFTWDGASQLIGCDGATLSYDGLGHLLTRGREGKTTRFHYNLAVGLDPVMAESDGETGQFLRYYVWTPSGVLLYMIDATSGNKVSFFHFDHLGSTLALTDAKGQVTDAYSYGPYGKLLRHTGDSTQPFTFAGRQGVRREGDSGTIHHMHARYYDADTGRFVSKEPIWPDITDPRRLNPYQYAVDEPIGHLDITGLVTEEMMKYVWNWYLYKSYYNAYELWRTGEFASKDLSPEDEDIILQIAMDKSEFFQSMIGLSPELLQERLMKLRDEDLIDAIKGTFAFHGKAETVGGAFPVIDAAARNETGPPCESQRRTRETPVDDSDTSVPWDSTYTIDDWFRDWNSGNYFTPHYFPYYAWIAINNECAKDPIWCPVRRQILQTMLMKITSKYHSAFDVKY